MEKPVILVIEDDENIKTQMKWALARDYEVFLAGDGEKAMELMERERPHLVILDLGLPPHPEDTSEGMRLLDRILQNEPNARVIVVTGNPDRSAALQAVSRGAHDFFTKPIDLEELKAILKRACYVCTLEAEYRELQKQLEQRALGEIIGSSPGIQEIFAIIRKVATTDVPVLITGESGTGKELTAKAIHTNSIRQTKPFVPINCGAIPENLMESELFGYEKGAFTGAHSQRKGRIELAEGGTLFLDEIADLPLSLQVKILRFLQDHRIERVGGRETIEIDCRVIAASNRDIKKLISEGLFRDDLYYRLAVVTIHMPPLRKRREDILLLTKSFLRKFSTERGRPRSLSYGAIEALTTYEWPGNVRELENRIRRALTLAEGSAITPADFGLEAVQETAQPLDVKKARKALEIKLINMAILKHNCNISKAAEDLGLSRPAVHYLIKKYNIRLEKGA
ncbi:MAG TPA: PEP-CTERM-box response regulator transcription factor [Nitrospirae bacterium]|nr:nitrogen regulation protein [bacterium BMS3Abin10]GBE38642.1 nitrogen regulation protein [bacterium BMS3Bbin08]HDO25369.1 PEP-CTERM-box response regulator transcription factor [Nitrospirota bacterium]